jgi:hypothetical protein
MYYLCTIGIVLIALSGCDDSALKQKKYHELLQQGKYAEAVKLARSPDLAGKVDTQGDIMKICRRMLADPIDGAHAEQYRNLAVVAFDIRLGDSVANRLVLRYIQAKFQTR